MVDVGFFMYRLCKLYDEILDKVQEMLDNISDLVVLIQFLENVSFVIVVNLQIVVDEVGERLLFLFDYVIFLCMFKFFLFIIFQIFLKRVGVGQSNIKEICW